MLCALRQIEPDIFPEIANYLKHYEEELKRMVRNRYYRMLRINKKEIRVGRMSKYQVVEWKES